MIKKTIFALVFVPIFIPSLWISTGFAANQNLTGNGQWASAGTHLGTDVGNASDAFSGQSIDINGHTLTVTNDNIADDGNGKNTFVIGALSDTASTGLVNVHPNGVAGTGDLTVYIDSGNVGSNFTVQNANNDNLNTTVAVTHALTVGGNLNLTNNEATNTKSITMSVGDNLQIAGLTTITANSGGAGAASALYANGSTVTSTGGFVLDDNVGVSYLILSGSSIQTVTGTINGASDGEGVLKPGYYANAIFDSDIGATHKLSAIYAVDNTTTFNGNVSANSLILFNASSIVKVGSGKNLTAAVTASADNDGTLTLVGGSQTVTGQVGSDNTHRISVLNAGATGAADIFTANVFAKAINAGSNGATTTGTGTLTFNGNVDTGVAGTLNFGGNGTVVMANGSNLTSPTISATTAGQGTLTVKGGTVTGSISSGSSLGTINAGENATTTFTGDIAATTVNVAGANTVNLQGNTTATTLAFGAAGTVNISDGKSISGSVSTGGVNQGTLTFLGASTVSSAIGATGVANRLTAVNVNGGEVINNANIFATTTTVNSGGTLTVGGNGTDEGNLTLAGTGVLNLQANTLTVNGAGGGVVTTSATNVIKTTLNSSSVFGNIASTGNASISSGTTVNATVTGALASGTALKILDGSAGGSNGQSITVTSNSNRYTFTAANTAGDIMITPTLIPSSSIASTSNRAAVGAVLDSISSTATGDMGTVENLLFTLSPSDYDKALQQLIPNVNGGVTQGSFSAVTNYTRALGMHFDQIRDTGVSSQYGEANSRRTGISTGDESMKTVFKDSGIWFKGFTNFSDQHDHQGINGYDSGLWGTVWGADGLVSDQVRLGLAGGYARTVMNSKNVEADADIHNYLATFYAIYGVDRWSMDTSFTFAWNNYDNSRRIAFSGLDRTADAGYDGQECDWKMSVRYDIEDRGFRVTPLVSLEYIHLNLDSYTETGAGDLDLHVNAEGFDFLQSGLGMKIAYPITDHNGTYIPEVHGEWLYDFIGDKEEVTSTFTGGGASFKTSGFRPAQNSFDLGTGVTFLSKNNVSLEGVYNLDLKSGYVSHSGNVALNYNF